jgi:hypothetical protein
MEVANMRLVLLMTETKTTLLYCPYSDFHRQSRGGTPAEYAKKLSYVGRVKYIHTV